MFIREQTKAREKATKVAINGMTMDRMVVEVKKLQIMVKVLLANVNVRNSFGFPHPYRLQ